jgi:hypothetical protein
MPLSGDDGERGGGPVRAPRRRFVFTVRLGLALVLPTGIAAQLPDFPTLRGAGVEYISGSGFFQVGLSGRLDLDAFHVGDSRAGLIDREEGEDPLPANREGCPRCHVGMAFQGTGGDLRVHRLRLFADIFLGDRIYSLLEVRTDRGPAPSDGRAAVRVEQAYLRVVSGRGSDGVQVGRFPSPFGSYPIRHLTTEDPFLRPPLAYDYRTVMSRTVVSRDATRLLGWKDAPDFFRKPGAPPVWAVPYQWGAMAFGRIGPIDLRVAAMNSAPSSDPAAWGFDWDRLRNPSWVVAARTQPFASLDLGVSYSRGPWMEKIVAGSIRPPDAPAGAEPPTIRDFDQEIVSADFSFARGPVVLRGEAMLDRWALPNIGDRPTELAYSLEAQWDLVAGLFVAARGGYIDFRPLDDGLGAASTLPDGEADWDYDVYRYEGSVGYRLARNVGLLFSAFRQTQTETVDGDTSLVGLRLWWAY